jgi:hypothetical protein
MKMERKMNKIDRKPESIGVKYGQSKEVAKGLFEL